MLLLIKNPAGANEAVRTVVDGGAPRVALVALNDAIADGRDVSWIWDVDFEPLLEAVETLVVDGRPRRGARAALPLCGRAARADRARAPLARARARPRGRADAARRGARLPADLHGDARAAEARGARGLVRQYWEDAA